MTAARRPALGPQARRALRSAPSAAIRLVPTPDDPPAVARPREPGPALPLGVPAIAAAHLEAAREAARVHDLERENAELRAHVADLEHELRRAQRDLDAAREAGARDERARQAKTHGGRLPSILTPGGGR